MSIIVPRCLYPSQHDLPLIQPSRREFLAYGSAALALGLPGGPLLARSNPPLRFMVVGDWGREGAFHQREVAAAMGDFQSSQFVVSTGDNFYEHGVRSITDRKWDSSFQRIYPNVPQQWYAVLGNHDYGGSVEAQIEKSFHDPRWRMPDYWFDVRLSAYGRPDIHLFFINTVVWRGSEKFPLSFLGSSVNKKAQARQREWLQARLGQSDAPVKIVFGHHPIYSVRTQGSYYGMADLDALFFDHGVTAYVNGHDHCMYHISAPDWRGKAAGNIHYICSGAGSQMRPTYPHCVPEGPVSQSACLTEEQLGPRKPYWHAFFTESPLESRNLEGGFAVFEIHDEMLDFRFIEPLPDVAAGTRWRERYRAPIPVRGVGRLVENS